MCVHVVVSHVSYTQFNNLKWIPLDLNGHNVIDNIYHAARTRHVWLATCSLFCRVKQSLPLVATCRRWPNMLFSRDFEYSEQSDFDDWHDCQLLNLTRHLCLCTFLFFVKVITSLTSCDSMTFYNKNYNRFIFILCPRKHTIRFIVCVHGINSSEINTWYLQSTSLDVIRD